MRTAGRVFFRSELLLINVCSLLLVLFVSLVDVQALRVVLGLPFMLFFPGYALVAALFPKRSDLGWRERIALSVGASVLVTPGVGLILTHFWGIRLYPILVSLTILIAVLSVAAWYRRWRCAEEDRLTIVLSLRPYGHGPQKALDGIMSLAVALAVIGAIGVMAWAFASPEQGERFTEFYMVGAESLPGEATVGQNMTVTLGIVNQEGEAMSYSVEVLAAGHRLTQAGPIPVDRGGSWEGEVGFAPIEASGRTRLTEAVTVPAGEVAGEAGTIMVETTAGLESGDHLMIGQEAAVAESIEGNAINLAAGLKQYHAPGTEVVEVQKVEFRLFKNWGLGDGETYLALWVGEERLAATVRYQGDGQASYWIHVRVSGNQGEEPVTRSVGGPPEQAAGDAWTAEIDYPFSEINEVRFALYEDDALLYETLESEPYPALHLWVVVS